MTQSSVIFPENAVSQPGYDRYDTVLTVNDLRKRYLHGVDLRDSTGKNLSKQAVEFYLKSAISQIEHDYEITITPTKYMYEPHDYKMVDYWNWSLIRLKHKPVISIEELQLRVTNPDDSSESDAVIPNSWIRLTNLTGQFQLAPITGSIGTFNIGNTTFLPRILIFNDTFPAFFRVTYTAGFEINRIPAIINNAIGLTAALRILSIAGDLVLGAGVASSSIGLDGLSKSISTTASAMYGAYSARMEDYRKELKKIEGILKKYYGKTLKAAVV